jgi:hypothetical protein
MLRYQIEHIWRRGDLRTNLIGVGGVSSDSRHPFPMPTDTRYLLASSRSINT